MSQAKPKLPQSRGPVVVPQLPARGVRRAGHALGPAALDMPVPGSLLVLLSRLHRAERAGLGETPAKAG